MSKLEEVSYEMVVFLHPRVLSRVAGFPVASPCLWGKLENMSFSNVSKQVESGKLLSGLRQISHSVICIFSVLRRQTFRLCSIARGHQAFTVHDRRLIEIVQDGDFRMFVADIQANVACTEVVLIQA